RLHSREGEVETGDARDRERERFRISVAGQPVERGTARIAEPQEARALVERLAGRVVERRPDHAKAGVVLHIEQHRVSTGRQEAKKRWIGLYGFQVERGNVAV